MEIRASIMENNRIYGRLKTQLEQLNEADYDHHKIVFLEDVPGAMPRTYNAPKCAEVALITNTNFEEMRQNYKRSVVIPLQPNHRLEEIPHYHPAFELAPCRLGIDYDTTVDYQYDLKAKSYAIQPNSPLQQSQHRPSLDRALP